MHDLIQKYRDNELSAEDVRKLRKLLDGMSDNELAGILEKDWEVYKADGEQRLPTGMESRLRRNIHSVVGKVHSKWHIAFVTVACVMAAIICVGLGYIAHVGMPMSEAAHDVYISANDTGGTSVTFPDGSAVSMKPQSYISYHVPPSAEGERSIQFSGTGHFCIARIPENPFTISSDMLDVTVLGTEFYLSAENDGKNARLYLQEGLVRFQSKLSGESVELHPGSLASLDYESGRISVSTDSSLVDVFSKSDAVCLNYENTSLGSVVESLNTRYAPFHITLGSAELGKMEFTGTLPANNLMEALSVLEYTANLRISVSNSEVTLYE